MKVKIPWYDKPLYSNSNIRFQDVAWVLSFILLLVPLVLKQADKKVNYITLVIITILILGLLILGDLIYRTKVLRDLKSLDKIDDNIYSVSWGFRVVLAACLLIALYYFIMSVGLVSIYIIYLVFALCKLVLGFFPRILNTCLACFYPNMYSMYREKSIEFKYKYSINMTSSLYLMGIIIIPFIRNDMSKIMVVQPLWSGGIDISLAVGLSIISVGISWLLVKKFEIGSLSKNESFIKYKIDYSKPAGGIYLINFILVVIIWLTLGGFCFT